MCQEMRKTIPTSLEWYNKVKPLTEKYYDTFSRYKSYSYASINESLRYAPEIEKRYGFNAIIDTFPPIEKDIYVYRLIGLKERTLIDKYNNIGVPFVSLGYMSTTLLGSRSYNIKCELIYGRPNDTRSLLRIKIPKGKKAYFFLDMTFEAEVLFKHNEILVPLEHKKVNLVCPEISRNGNDGEKGFDYVEIDFYDMEMK